MLFSALKLYQRKSISSITRSKPAMIYPAAGLPKQRMVAQPLAAAGELTGPADTGYSATLG
jgi:hypothetical protein